MDAVNGCVFPNQPLFAQFWVDIVFEATIIHAQNYGEQPKVMLVTALLHECMEYQVGGCSHLIMGVKVFQLSDFIAQKSAETDYKPQKDHCLRLVQEINNQIKSFVGKTGS